jgi:hypothetical protein
MFDGTGMGRITCELEDLILFSSLLCFCQVLVSRDEFSRSLAYLVCTAKSAVVGFWFFSVFGKSITYLFSVPPGGSIPVPGYHIN